MKEGINKRIRAIRKDLGLKQRQFFERTGISVATLSRAENSGEVTEDTIIKLHKGLGVSTDYLFEGKGDMYINGRPEIHDSIYESNSPWRDEAYNAVKQQAEEWKRKFEQLFESYLKLTTSGKPNALVLPGRSRNAGVFTGVAASV